MVTVNFILNGKPVSAEADGLTLLKYLRGVACLKGAKEGCSTGHCGACTVLLDGKPVRSCVTRMDKLEGKSVVTIEALHGADGAVLAQGERRLADPGFLQGAARLDDSDPLRFEKRLIDDWLRREFPAGGKTGA